MKFFLTDMKSVKRIILLLLGIAIGIIVLFTQLPFNF
jgi:hypothetical protein